MASNDPWWWTQYFDPYQESVAKEQAVWDSDPGAAHDAGPYTSKAQAQQLGPAQYAKNVATAKALPINQPGAGSAKGWYYNSATQQVMLMTGAQAAQISANLGYHAVVGPYATEALARSEGPQQTFSNPNSNPATDATVNALEGAVGGFLGVLENKALWLRIGEVVLGLVLVGVGLARLTGAQNIISKAAKVAI